MAGYDFGARRIIRLDSLSKKALGGVKMTAKKGRTFAIVSGLIIYVVLAYQGISNYTISSITRDFFLIPVATVVITFLILGILPKGEIKNTRNDGSISLFQFWAMISFPIVLGLIALVYLSINGTYTGIVWIIFGIVFSIVSNGRDLIINRNEKRFL